MKPAGSASPKKRALVGGELKAFEAVDRCLHAHCATKQFSPAAFSVWQACFASAGEAAPARSRIPPVNGTIILFIAAIVGKRADSAVHARSACAWLAKAPSWMTLPVPPVAAGSALGPARHRLPWSGARGAAGGCPSRLGDRRFGTC